MCERWWWWRDEWDHLTGRIISLVASFGSWKLRVHTVNKPVLIMSESCQLFSRNIRRSLCFHDWMSRVADEKWGLQGCLQLCGTGQFPHETHSNVLILVHFKWWLLTERVCSCSGKWWALCVGRGCSGCHRSRWGWLVDGEKKWPHWIGPGLLPCQRMSLPDSPSCHILFWPRHFKLSYIQAYLSYIIVFGRIIKLSLSMFLKWDMSHASTSQFGHMYWYDTCSCCLAFIAGVLSAPHTNDSWEINWSVAQGRCTKFIQILWHTCISAV